MTAWDAAGWAACLLFVVSALIRGADLLAHYGRYRHHLHLYPATRQMRGKVWKGTR